MPHQKQREALAPLGIRDFLHIVGRAIIALGIGWGYLLAVALGDFGGLASWAMATPIGMMAMTMIWGITGVAFAITGAHIGWMNVAGEAARAHAADAAARRGEARYMGRRP
ncbi:hypothetical protein [Rubrimonas sp.]|uniref:hypothetical protein n=1 Tax=Rubrimonas sp. TaxID=2036015 RepID=UPI002FDD387A